MRTFFYYHKKGLDIFFFYWWSYLLLLGLFTEALFWFFWDIYSFLSSCPNSTFYVIKFFRCDLDGEYTSNKFCELFVLDGTIHQISCVDTLKQNGVAKRKHRHIVKTARSLLLSTFVPDVFWRKVVLIAVNLINTILSSHISGFSHFKKLYGYALIIHSLKFLLVLVLFFILM